MAAPALTDIKLSMTPVLEISPSTISVIGRMMLSTTTCGTLASEVLNRKSLCPSIQKLAPTIAPLIIYIQDSFLSPYLVDLPSVTTSTEKTKIRPPKYNGKLSTIEYTLGPCLLYTSPSPRDRTRS